MKVAKIPINHYPSVLTVLDLPSYPALWTLLGTHSLVRCSMACTDPWFGQAAQSVAGEPQT
jgi:hypothetical protein